MRTPDPLRALAWLLLVFALLAVPFTVIIAKEDEQMRYEICRGRSFVGCAPRSQGGILAVGLTLAGVTAVVALLLLAIRRPQGARPSEARIACPYCAEAILPAARVCPFCRRDLTESSGPTFGERLRR